MTPGQVWTGGKSRTTGIRSPDRQSVVSRYNAYATRYTPHYVAFSNLVPVTSLLASNILPKAAPYTLQFKGHRHHAIMHSVKGTKCARANYSAAHKGLSPIYRSVNTFKPNIISTQHPHPTCVTSKQKLKTFQKQNRTLETRPQNAEHMTDVITE